MSLGNVGGLIGTAVGLAVLVGVAGLAFRAIDRTFDGDRPRRKTKRRDDGFFGISNSAPRDRRSVGAGKAPRTRGADNIFDLGLTQRSSQRPAGRKKKFRNEFGTDFNIFAV